MWRQLEELHGFRASAAGESAGDENAVDMEAVAEAGGLPRVGETAQILRIKHHSPT